MLRRHNRIADENSKLTGRHAEFFLRNSRNRASNALSHFVRANGEIDMTVCMQANARDRGGDVSRIGACRDAPTNQSAIIQPHRPRSVLSSAPSHDSPHSQMAPNMCATRGWAASIWVNRLM